MISKQHNLKRILMPSSTSTGVGNQDHHSLGSVCVCVSLGGHSKLYSRHAKKITVLDSLCLTSTLIPCYSCR